MTAIALTITASDGRAVPTSRHAPAPRVLRASVPTAPTRGLHRTVDAAPREKKA